MALIPVGREDQIRDGELVPIEVAGVAMILYRTGDRYVAVQRHCIHQRADLVHGHLDGPFLVCPVHGWRYHATTGVHELSPQTCLRTYAVHVHGGNIHVDPTPMWQGEIIP